ncbi:hypothetical protein B0H11DRAFT_2238121 [Mycena galericulata]|nr:hypothetical protein B0H11DRAFT_2238121 [Mycena galericulata]
MPNMAAIRVQAPTIRLMSIDFADDWWYDSPLEFLTSTFNVPNLEYLELLQAFSPLCSISEFPYGFRLPPEWELEPQFPHLHTLRLQNTALTPGRLALLQVLTRGISELELVDTGGFHHPGRLYRRTAVQLNNSDDEYHLFPVESFDGKVDIPWPCYIRAASL